jgi:polyhydroxybutyrate depolymerase
MVLPLVASCCGRPADPPRDGTLNEDQTFEHGGRGRTYHFYEPADVSGPRPLALLLHGGGGVIDDHIGLGAVDWPHQLWLDIADEDGLYVLVPQGIDSQWNDCRTDCPHCGVQDDVGFLLALIDDLSTRHDIDPARIYAIGESNGGLMAQRLAQEAAERFAGIGAVIALMPQNTECTAPSELPIAVMYQVGTADATIPYEGGLSGYEATGEFQSAAASVALWVAHNQCEETPTADAYPDLDPADGSTATREDYACPSTGTAVSITTMDGAGHVAPSIEVQVSGLWEALAGKQNHDLEGAREIWAFLQDHSR